MTLERYGATGKGLNYLGSNGLTVEIMSITPQDEFYRLVGTGIRSTWGLSNIVIDSFPEKRTNRAATILALEGKLFGGQHLEGPRISFAVRNLSRSGAQQLTRQRFASFGHEGTRDTSLKNFDACVPYGLPPAILERWVRQLNEIRQLISDTEDAGVPYQDSSMIAPLGLSSDLVVHASFRTLLDWAIRLTNQTKWEINALFKLLQEALARQWPEVSLWFVAPCERVGHCVANPTLFPPCGKFKHPRKAGMTENHFGEPYKFPHEANAAAVNAAAERKLANAKSRQREELVKQAKEVIDDLNPSPAVIS